MSAIRSAAEDYLAIRRSLGFKLGTQGRVLMDFVEYLEQAGMTTVTTKAAVEWAAKPSSASALWHAMRLGVARRFAAHLRLLDGHRVVSFISVVGCGTLPSSGIRQTAARRSSH